FPVGDGEGSKVIPAPGLRIGAYHCLNEDGVGSIAFGNGVAEADKFSVSECLDSKGSGFFHEKGKGEFPLGMAFSSFLSSLGFLSSHLFLAVLTNVISKFQDGSFG